MVPNEKKTNPFRRVGECTGALRDMPVALVHNQLHQAENNSASVVPIALLATAAVRLKFPSSTSPGIRALCDTGAQVNLITRRIVQKMRLPIEPSTMVVSGVGGVAAGSDGLVQVQLCNHEGKELEMTLQLVVVSEIASILPAIPIQAEFVRSFKHGQLADPAFNVPGRVDILLGAGVWANIIESEIVNEKGGMAAQFSKLGWLVFGEQRIEPMQRACYITQTEIDQELDRNLRRIWEDDRTLRTVEHTPEERRCEEMFAATHKRDESGRFVVSMPLLKDPSLLGESSKIARSVSAATWN